MAKEKRMAFNYRQVRAIRLDYSELRKDEIQEGAIDILCKKWGVKFQQMCDIVTWKRYINAGGVKPPEGTQHQSEPVHPKANSNGSTTNGSLIHVHVDGDLDSYKVFNSLEDAAIYAMELCDDGNVIKMKKQMVD